MLISSATPPERRRGKKGWPVRDNPRFGNRFDPHQHRRADDQGGDDQPNRDPVGHLLKPDDEGLLIDRIDGNLEIVVRDRVEDLVDPGGQSLEEIL